MSNVKLSAAQSNAAFMGMLNDGQAKQAQDMATDYTRVKIRESSFFEKIMPAMQLADDELTPQIGTDKNVKLVEREPNSPAAITIPLGQQPIEYYFRGDRYPVYFDRIVTPKFTKDTSELRTYGMDIRQVLTDNAILDMDFEFDRKMLAAAQVMVGAEGSVVPETGEIQNVNLVDAGGVTRDVLFEMKKILPRTFAHLDAVTLLVNNITIHDVAKHDRLEVGGDLSQDMYVKGFQQTELAGLNWVVTNKTELVAENEFWLWASPEFLGKSYVLEDTTMYIDKKAFNLEFYAYCERGATFAHPGAVAKVRVSKS